MPKKVHIQLLEKELVHGLRKEKLEKFQWWVVDLPSKNAVLLDCIALAQDAKGWRSYIIADQKSMTLVVVPLSPSKLVVGRVVGDWEEVAEIYGKTSLDSCFYFYLPNHQSEVSKADLSELGNSARAGISELTYSAVRKAVEEYIGDDARISQENSKPITWNKLSEEGVFSYSAFFKDFGEDALAKRVAEQFIETVKTFGFYFSIQRLDGITFAVDYAAALHELDRGQGVGGSIDPSAVADLNSVATPLVVQRTDGVKTHIILRGYLAE